MSEFSLGDGVVVTIVAMGTVFAVLAALWGLMEIVHILVERMGKGAETAEVPVSGFQTGTPSDQYGVDHLVPDEERKRVAIFAALIEAHSEEPGTKYEILEVERVE